MPRDDDTLPWDERVYYLVYGLGRIYVVVAAVSIFWLYWAYFLELTSGSFLSIARPWWVWVPGWLITLPILALVGLAMVLCAADTVQEFREHVLPAVRTYAKRTVEDIRAGVTGRDES